MLNGTCVILAFHVVTTTKKLANLLLLKLIGKVENTPRERESNKRRLPTCVILYSWFLYVVWVDDCVRYSVLLGRY